MTSLGKDCRADNLTVQVLGSNSNPVQTIYRASTDYYQNDLNWIETDSGELRMRLKEDGHIQIVEGLELFHGTENITTATKQFSVGLNSTGGFVVRDEVNERDVILISSGGQLNLDITNVTGLQSALDSAQQQFYTQGGLSISTTVLDSFGLTQSGDGASYDRSLITAKALEDFIEGFQESLITVLPGQDSGHRISTITATPSSTNVPSALAVATYVTSRLNTYSGDSSKAFVSSEHTIASAVKLASASLSTQSGLQVSDVGGGSSFVAAADFIVGDTSIFTLLDGKQNVGDYVTTLSIGSIDARLTALEADSYVSTSGEGVLDGSLSVSGVVTVGGVLSAAALDDLDTRLDALEADSYISTSGAGILDGSLSVSGVVTSSTLSSGSMNATVLTKGGVNVLDQSEVADTYATQSALNTYAGNSSISFAAQRVILDERTALDSSTADALAVRNPLDSQYLGLLCSDLFYGSNGDIQLTSKISSIESDISGKHPLSSVDYTSGGTLSSGDLITSGAVYAGYTDLQVQIDGKQPSGAYLTSVPANTNANLIANGSVSNTAFQYLAGVTSGIQAQLNNKSPLFSIDAVPVQSSSNLVTSGGVFSAIHSVALVTPEHEGDLSVSGTVTVGGILSAAALDNLENTRIVSLESLPSVVISNANQIALINGELIGINASINTSISNININTTNISGLTDLVSDALSLASSNASSINTNSAFISVNGAAILANSSNIASLTASNSNHDTRLDSLEAGSYISTSGVGVLDGSLSVSGILTSSSISIGSLTSRISQPDLSASLAIGFGAGSDQDSFFIAIGSEAGQSQSIGGIAIGKRAGRFNQSAHSIAIGQEAGRDTQGINSVAIGNLAAPTNQAQDCVAIGFFAGSISQGASCVAIGRQSGNIRQGGGAVALGTFAGLDTQGDLAIAVGNQAGFLSQSGRAVAIGQQAGRDRQGVEGVAIGRESGRFWQGTAAVAVGPRAGYISQGGSAVAIGNNAGYFEQHERSIVLNATGSIFDSQQSDAFYVKPIREAAAPSILYYDETSGEITYSGGGNYIPAFGDGVLDGSLSVSGSVTVGGVITSAALSTVSLSLGATTIALGLSSGSGAVNSICIGVDCGTTTQGLRSAAVGYKAGQINQGADALAIGSASGNSDQAANAVSIGLGAGSTSQGESCVAVGTLAGSSDQQIYSIAIGHNAGQLSQGQDSIAIGRSAGSVSLGEGALALGYLTGNAASNRSVSIGYATGSSADQDSVAVGAFCGVDSGLRCTAIGLYAGGSLSQEEGVAIGDHAGFLGQRARAVAIGHDAGYMGVVHHVDNSVT